MKLRKEMWEMEADIQLRILYLLNLSLLLPLTNSME